MPRHVGCAGDAVVGLHQVPSSGAVLGTERPGVKPTSRGHRAILAALVAGATLTACAGTPAPAPPGASSASGGTVVPARASAPGSAPATAQARAAEPVDVQTLQAFADGLRQATGSDGGIVAVRYGASEPAIVSTGVADVRTGEPIDVRGAFQIASVTKSFTAALSLMLADDGALDLDAPISRWLPEWPDADRITLRLLLQHRAGVASFGNRDDTNSVATEMILDSARNYTMDEVLARAVTIPRFAEPGAATHYSNLGFILVGRVIELATGKAFGDVLAERIAAPLRLSSTWYPPSGPPGPVSMPGTVEIVEGAPPLNIADFPGAARASTGASSGAMIGSVADLLTWSDIVLRAKRLDGHDLSAMSNIHAGGYGLGVIGVGPTGACVFAGCPEGTAFDRLALNGDTHGSSVRVLHDPATDITLLVYLNKQGLSLDAPMLELFATELT